MLASRPLTVPSRTLLPHRHRRQLQIPCGRKAAGNGGGCGQSHLADAVSRGVAPATLTKLTTIFRKQFLAWTASRGSNTWMNWTWTLC